MDSRAFFEAIERGDAREVGVLLERHPALLRARTASRHAPEGQRDRTALHAAVLARSVEVARVLAEAGIDLEARTADGRTALHDSIEFGAVEITDLLLARGAELDICSAAILGRLDRVRALLDGDPELANDRSTSLSPLGWASFGNQAEVATELIERGARMDDGELLCAASVGHVEVGRVLIDRGIDPDALFSEAGCRAVHAAAAMRYTHDSRRFIRMLFEKGADIRARTTDGRTALEIAEERARLQDEALAENPAARRRRFEEVAALLRELG